MSKQKKTRQQKVNAQFRRKSIDTASTSSKNSIDIPFSYTYSHSAKKSTITRQNTSEYQYHLKDLVKTGILTSSLVLFELLLFVLLKQKIIVIPSINF